MEKWQKKKEKGDHINLQSAVKKKHAGSGSATDIEDVVLHECNKGIQDLFQEIREEIGRWWMAGSYIRGNLPLG